MVHLNVANKSSEDNTNIVEAKAKAYPPIEGKFKKKKPKIDFTPSFPEKQSSSASQEMELI